MSAKDLLVEAKNLINISGWTQGDYGDEDKGYCTVGALATVSDPDDLHSYFTASKALKVALRESGYITDVAAWNDAETRTKDQVLDIFDKAVSHV